MNTLMVSTPATDHINPLLGVARVLIAEGHNVVCLSGSALRDRIESAGAGFRALPPAADFDLNDPFATAPELKVIPPGLEWLRVALERLFIERIVPQHESMRSSLFGRVGLGWLKSLPAPALPTRATFRVGSDAFMAFRCLGSLPEPTECAGFARTVALFFLNCRARREARAKAISAARRQRVVTRSRRQRECVQHCGSRSMAPQSKQSA